MLIFLVAVVTGLLTAALCTFLQFYIIRQDQNRKQSRRDDD